jgi:hypothetical protein
VELGSSENRELPEPRVLCMKSRLAISREDQGVDHSRDTWREIPGSRGSAFRGSRIQRNRSRRNRDFAKRDRSHSHTISVEDRCREVSPCRETTGGIGIS